MISDNVPYTEIFQSAFENSLDYEYYLIPILISLEQSKHEHINIYIYIYVCMYVYIYIILCITMSYRKTS